MKPVYAVRCDFQGDALQAAASAWSSALTWIGLDVDAATSDCIVELADGSTARLRAVVETGAEVRHLDHSIPPTQRAAAGWRTLLWVVRDGDRVSGVVRSGPERTPGVVTVLQYDAHRPRVVGDWADELVMVRDGRRLSQRALNYGMHDGDALIELLLDVRRELPVVGVAKATGPAGARVVADPDRLARDLAGNAHVIVLDPALAWTLTERLGQPLTAHSGAVRIWWPRMSLTDDPYRHTLVMADRFIASSQRAHRHITHRVWRAAVDAIGIPPLEAQLVRQRNHRSVEARVAALAERSTDGDKILTAFEEQLQLNEELDDRLGELELENSELREALAAAAAAVDDDDDEVPEVDTVEEAVRAAAAEADGVVYLEAALDSARRSQYPNPTQVLKDLRAINRVACRWRAGELPAGFKEAFADEPVTYCPDIGKVAATKFRADYEIAYGGRQVLMGPHLRRGTGAPTAILRIYWYVDNQARQLVVGHVGQKLRDVSNP